MSSINSDNPQDFTPASPMLAWYDPFISVMTRESLWRGTLLRQVAPQAGDVIVDAGCGTASFLVLLGRTSVAAQLFGIDPDPSIIAMARRKLDAAGVSATLQRGYLRDAENLLAGKGVNKIVSSLVFHQVPLAEKRAGLAAIFAALTPGGELHIADYGLQRTRLMRTLFRFVQTVDGYTDTQPNADGILPRLIKEAGFVDVEEATVIPTATGSISLYRAVRPRDGLSISGSP